MVNIDCSIELPLHSLILDCNRLFHFTISKNYTAAFLHLFLSFLHAGNWSPSDFPNRCSFPPYPDSAWQKTNRNLLVVMEDEGVVQDFYTVFVEDGMRGEPWTPKPVHHEL